MKKGSKYWRDLFKKENDECYHLRTKNRQLESENNQRKDVIHDFCKYSMKMGDRPWDALAMDNTLLRTENERLKEKMVNVNRNASLNYDVVKIAEGKLAEAESQLRDMEKVAAAWHKRRWDVAEHKDKYIATLQSRLRDIHKLTNKLMPIVWDMPVIREIANLSYPAEPAEKDSYCLNHLWEYDKESSGYVCVKCNDFMDPPAEKACVATTEESASQEGLSRTDETQTLKPCKKCGSSDGTTYEIGEVCDSRSGAFHIVYQRKCSCGHSGPREATREAANKAWDEERPDEDTLKPCPSCGSTNITEHYCLCPGAKEWDVRFACECGVSGPWKKGKTGELVARPAHKGWNAMPKNSDNSKPAPFNLKPCPRHCDGGRLRIGSRHPDGCSEDREAISPYVYCANCGLRGPEGLNEQIACDIWDKLPRKDTVVWEAAWGDDHKIVRAVKELFDDMWIFYKPDVHPKQYPLTRLTAAETRKYGTNCYTSVEELMK
jgi:hypothetical protein